MNDASPRTSPVCSEEASLAEVVRFANLMNVTRESRKMTDLTLKTYVNV